MHLSENSFARSTEYGAVEILVLRQLYSTVSCIITMVLNNDKYCAYWQIDLW